MARRRNYVNPVPLSQRRTIGQIHRFGNRVGFHSGDGETRYIALDHAKALANALAGCIADIESRQFTGSQFASFNFETQGIYDKESGSC